ncbi:MAG: YeeE/YedE family protein [Pseudomonadota bacterium]
MLFQTFASAQSVMLWAAFGVALIMGAVANKTNFCTMGAISDLVNMGDSGRFRAWVLAIAVALAGVAVLEMLGVSKIDQAFPPYRQTQFLWAEHLLGGLLFGVGMTLASGCGNKTLLRIGGGNIKSLLVFLIIAVIAYFMVNPFPGSDKTLMSVMFYDWIRPLAINLGKPQDLGSLLGGDNAHTARIVIGFGMALALLAGVFLAAEFRKSGENILGGVVIGAGVVAAWYITSAVAVSGDGEHYGLGDYVKNWDFLASSTDGKPADSRPLSPQSYTFINPMGQTLGYVASGFGKDVLTFGVMAVFGVVLGSLLWSLISRSFRIEWFVDFKDFLNHFIGAVLMGFGGVLAMGCTIGQGITGISTLALGGFLTFFSIVAGSAITMKIQYRLM